MTEIHVQIFMQKLRLFEAGAGNFPVPYAEIAAECRREQIECSQMRKLWKLQVPTSHCWN